MQYSGDVRDAGRGEVQRPSLRSGGGWSRASEDRGIEVRVIGQDLPLADLQGQRAGAGAGWNDAGRRRSSYRDGSRGGDGPVRQGEGWDLVTVGPDGGGAPGNNFVGGWIEDSANGIEGGGRSFDYTAVAAAGTARRCNERGGSVRSERETAAGIARRGNERDGRGYGVEAGMAWRENERGASVKRERETATGISRSGNKQDGSGYEADAAMAWRANERDGRGYEAGAGMTRRSPDRGGSERSERETAAGMTRRSTDRDGSDRDVAGRRWKMNAEAVAAGTMSRGQEGTGTDVPRGVFTGPRIFFSKGGGNGEKR